MTFLMRLGHGGRAVDSALECLVAACEEAFIGGLDHPVDDANEVGPFADEEDVSSPPTGITFGMIREARKALAKQD